MSSVVSVVFKQLLENFIVLVLTERFQSKPWTSS